MNGMYAVYVFVCEYMCVYGVCLMCELLSVHVCVVCMYVCYVSVYEVYLCV